MFNYSKIISTDLNTPELQVRVSASRALRPLPAGIARRHFSWLGATRDVTMGVARETALASSTIFLFYMENTDIHELKLKTSCYNRDWDRSVGVCCHNALGLVRTVRQKFDFLFRTQFDNKTLRNRSYTILFNYETTFKIRFWHWQSLVARILLQH